MARIEKTICDVCGAEESEDDTAWVSINVPQRGDDGYGGFEDKDVCPSCNEKYDEVVWKFFGM